MPEQMQENEIHIASLIVHTRPEDLARIRAAVEQLEGTEAHDQSDLGKLIVTVEAPTEKKVLSTIEEIQAMNGTLSAAMVYHHCEDLNSQENSQDQAGDLQ